MKLKEKTCKAGEANVVVGMAKVVSAEHMMSGGNPAAAKTVASTVTKDNRHDPKCLARVEETVDWYVLLLPLHSSFLHVSRLYRGNTCQLDLLGDSPSQE